MFHTCIATRCVHLERTSDLSMKHHIYSSATILSPVRQIVSEEQQYVTIYSRQSAQLLTYENVLKKDDRKGQIVIGRTQYHID